MSDEINFGESRVGLCGYCRNEITDDDIVGLINKVPYHSSCKNEHLKNSECPIQSLSLKDSERKTLLPILDDISDLVLYSYRDLEFEPCAPRSFFTGEKTTYNFSASRTDLRSSRGFERHARPYEHFGLICDVLEGKKEVFKLRDVYHDMMIGPGDLLGVKIECKGGFLYCYESPDDDFDSSLVYVRKFSLNGLSPGDLHNARVISEHNPSITRYFWSRDFEDLPLHLRTSAYIRLPTEWHCVPIACENGSYGIRVIDWFMGGGASRGVRRKNSSITIAPKKSWFGGLFGK